jgi:hypothetical protein
VEQICGKIGSIVELIWHSIFSLFHNHEKCKTYGKSVVMGIELFLCCLQLLFETFFSLINELFSELHPIYAQNACKSSYEASIIAIWLQLKLEWLDKFW